MPGSGDDIRLHLSLRLVDVRWDGIALGVLNLNGDFEVLGPGSNICVLVDDGCMHIL